MTESNWVKCGNMWVNLDNVTTVLEMGDDICVCFMGGLEDSVTFTKGSGAPVLAELAGE